MTDSETDRMADRMRFVIDALRPFVFWLCRLWFRVRFRGVENVPPAGPCIITPNHVTFADPIWITVPLKRRVNYMAWDKMFAIPVLGFLMRAFGAFPVNLERADASAQREALNHLKRGCALVIFPEGGRTRSGRIEPFKMGAFRLALTQGVPIVPVTIEGGYEIWPAGKWFPRPGRLTITYHPSIKVDRINEGASRLELKGKARELARKTHDVVVTALGPESLPEGETTVLSAES
ncbi:MAG TPA: lysophospholipid acyltransferase family protein [Blastocatellia bacterium]|nr:lysophospholipid acyltransferase family protein [Blastocatellia bacterium]